MKQWLLRVGILLLALLLTSCAYQRINSNVDLTRETWQRHVDIRPDQWMKGGDHRWFLSGCDNTAEAMNRRAPINAAMSTMAVRVPSNFTNIKVNGNFQVQLVGTDEDNAVYIYGPNSAIREVVVNVSENTLYLKQSDAAPRCMNSVIIRIGIKNLRHLTQAGGGLIEGRLLRSSDLSIFSSGSGPIYLGGTLNLRCITSTGSGSINVFGANTSDLNITTSGSGTVNVCGRVGVHCITHHGCGDVNIIGAMSNRLTIHADGKGKIGIKGHVSVQEIIAKGHACVYIYDLQGMTTRVYVMDRAHVGLAGCVKSLYVDANKGSCFEGRYLSTKNAYVRARDAAHMNVTANHQVFAAAMQNSSIYFFGPASILSQFTTENSIVVTLSGRPCGCPRACPAYLPEQSVYKDDV
jgi:hypothetical protein